GRTPARVQGGARGSPRVAPPEDWTVAETPQSPPPPPVFKRGDRVKTRRSGYRPGRIVELRGALGPGGAQIYRVRYRRKPPAYVEVREGPLVLIPPEA